MSELFFSSLKIILLIFFIYYYGFLSGSLIHFLIFLLYKYSLHKILNLEMLGAIDRCFIGSNNKERFNIVAVATFENFNAEKIRELTLERAVRKIPKFRKKLIHKFGNFFWTDATYEEASERVVIINNEKFKNDEDVFKLAEDEINLHINSLEELPYLIKLFPHHNKNSGTVIFKFDHVFSDGLGIISTICSLADNYDRNIFPSIMRSFKFRWYHDIIDWLSFIYFGPMVVFSMFSGGETNSPLRINEYSSGVCRFTTSKIYDLEKTKNFCRDFNISFNDYVMCIISKAVKNWKDYFEKNSQNSKKYENFENFSCFIPIGRKGIPKDTKDLQINNEVYGIYIRIPLIDNFIGEYKKIVEVLRNSLKSLGFVSAATRFCRIGVSLLPRDFQLYLGEKFLNNVDLIVSNVPGPTEPLYYAGCKLKMIAPIISTRNARAFLPIISYNKQFRFIMSVDVESKIDDNMFMNFIEKEIDSNLNERVAY